MATIRRRSDRPPLLSGPCLIAQEPSAVLAPNHMVDTLSPDNRRERMGRIRSKGSKPETAVRRLIHGMGFRYRLHAADLPGKPDLVFRGRHKVVFVHGCFWHRHIGCKLTRMPKTRQEFWRNKLEANRMRDLRNQAALQAGGWATFIAWECEVRDLDALRERVRAFLEAD